MSINILVVDREVATRALLAESLKRLGYRPSTASGLEDAVQVVNPGDFQVVIAGMSIGDSPKASLHAIDEIGGLDADLRFIVISEDIDRKSEVEAISRGAKVILRKPFDEHALQAAILSALPELKR